MLEDAELLRRYAGEKSDEAFAELVRRHLGLVYHAALRQCGGDAHRAEDVAQAVFTDLAHKAAKLAHRPVLAGWLYTSTRYAASQAVRGEARRQAREQEAHVMNELLGSTGDESAADWERLRPVIDDALCALSERDREAVLLRFFESRPFAEVGAKFLLSEDAARMRMERALEKLRTVLTRRGIASTTAALGVALANQAAAAVPAGITASVTSAALAGATAVSVSSLAGFLTYMSTTKIVSGVAATVALLAIFSATHEAGKARDFATQLNSVTEERDHLRSRLEALQKRGTLTPSNSATGQFEHGPQMANTTATTENPSARAAAWQGPSPVNYALDHPEARAAFVDQEVQRAKAKFERFFERTGLSPEDQEKFLGVLKNFAEAKLDLTAAVRAQGYGPYNVPTDPQALQSLFEVDAQVDGEFMGDLRTLLGDERYQQFSAYRKTIPELNVADQLASQLYDSATPLTAAQANQLVGILQENRFDKKSIPSAANTLNGIFIPDQANQAGMGQSNLVNGDIMMPGIDWRAPVTDAAVARAETILVPAQIAALRRMQAQQSAQLLLAPPPPSPRK